MRLPRSVVAVAATLVLTTGGLHAATSNAAVGGPLILLSTAELQQLPVMLGHDHSDRFAGTVVDNATKTVTVYTKDPVNRGKVIDPADLHSAVQGLPNRTAALYKSLGSTMSTSVNRIWTVKFVAATHSQAELDQIKASVLSKEPFASAVSSSIRMFSTDPASNTVQVGVAAVTPALRAAANATYGSDVQLFQAPTFSRASSRLLDSTPYYGGDRMVAGVDGNNVQCTAGFAYNAPMYSYPSMLTAGHCISGSPANGFYQGYADSSGKMHTSGWMGNSGWNLSGYNSADMGLLTAVSSGHFSDRVWTGSYNYIAQGLGNNSVGYPICADGSFTGENCSGVISRYNAWICLGWYAGSCNDWAENLVVAQSVNGTRLSQHGDSGGPVISGDPLLINGIIVLTSGDANFTSPGDGTWLAYTPIEDVMSTVGGGPVLH